MRATHKILLASTLCLAVFFGGQQAEAIILYSGDNSANQTAPDAARTDIFNAVARVCDSNGSSTSGSAVRLRGKYLLTANHVSLRSHVTFDGVTLWARDTTFTPVTFTGIDMKLIKLVNDPVMPDVELYTGTQEIPFRDKGSWQYTTGTLIGWGRGRSPTDPDGLPTWEWGGSATEAKRWGLNRIESSQAITYDSYNYTGLITQLDDDAGNNEAAASLFDSGSGVFIEDSGTWKLAGLTTAVQTNNSSTFSSSGDQNYFVRISSYASQIEAAIPDLAVFSDWKIDHGLSGSADDSDGDNDGIPLLLEFAFAGDPHAHDRNIIPTEQVIDDGNSSYLEITYRRPVQHNLTYTPKTTNDLNNWPSDSNDINAESVIDNGDGTETVTHRRTEAISNAGKAFMKIDVSVQP